MDLSASLRSWSQVLFSRDPWVGALLLVASLTDPWVGLHGVLAVLWGLGTAWLLRLDPTAMRDGLYSYNAMLVGLGVAALLPRGPGAEVVLAIGASTTVVLTAALRARSVQTGLPVLTLPFLAVLWLAWSIAPSLGTLPVVPQGPDRGLPEGLALGLKALGSLLFVPRVEAGALVLAALLRWSRQGALLGAVGFGVALALLAVVPIPPDASLPAMVSLNLALVAIALGGVWFVPSGSSFALAVASAAAAGLVTLGLAPLFARFGLPLAIAPFNLAVWAFLLASRQRRDDRSPKSVDFLPGTPEENLQYYRTRLARFGARYSVRLRAPVLGTWTVTQGDGDGPTHLGSWASAIDLEVADTDGRLSRGEGARREDHHCWHLPVLACGDGVVATVVDGVRDNPIGEVELNDNWGNVVVLWHGGSLYSLVAHLSPGTLKVEEGQRVRRGDVLGLCGSSGRSPRPHLHFQLQATAAVGAPTLPLELHDVVDVAAQSLRGAWTPATGDRVRNLVPDDTLREALGFVPNQPLALTLDGGPIEVVPEIDPFGRPVLRSGEDRLYYALEDDLLTIYDTLAPQQSALHILHAALARVPLEEGEDAPAWSDFLPPRTLAPAWLRPLQDLVAPFVRDRGLEIRYQMVREGRDRVVEGRSVRLEGDRPLLTTRAVLRPRVGLVEASRTLRGQTRTLTRTPS